MAMGKHSEPTSGLLSLSAAANGVTCLDSISGKESGCVPKKIAESDKERLKKQVKDLK